MTSFEEQFPSLEGNDCWKYFISEEPKFTLWEESGPGNLPQDCSLKKVYSEVEIQKHCLDKQRVKEAVTKHKIKCLKNKCIVGPYTKCILNILREIGLEE